MSTSPTDTLNVLAGLLPFHLAVERVRMQAALRLATLPSTNPLRAAVLNAAKRLVKRHPTPLHFLMNELQSKGVEIERMEQITAVRTTSKWVAPHTIAVEESKDMAALADITDLAEVLVYADGSGVSSEVGAAAVLYRRVMRSEEDGGGEIREKRGVMQYRLGELTEHTVYEAEEVGALMALELIRREPDVKSATICIDNQPVIRASITSHSVPGHHIMDALRWVPGHLGVEGNEEADELQDPLPVSRAAVRQRLRRKIAQRAARIWHQSPRYRRTSRLVQDLEDSKFQRSLATLPRKHASIITQLITGHIPLAYHLHRIGKSESSTCPACHEHAETVDHFLMHCPTHNSARATMLKGLYRGQRNVSHLMSSDETRLRVLNFVSETARLRSVFGEVPALEMVRDEEEEARTDADAELGDDGDLEAEA